MRIRHLVCAVGAAAILAGPVGTSFTYQGRLDNAGQPTTGVFESSFVFGGHMIFAGSSITGDNSGGSVAIDTSAASTAITITQVPSGQFHNFHS